MARWHADLQEYDFQLEYIPGKTNTVADALSRPANADQGQQDNKDITVLPQQICVLHTTKGTSHCSKHERSEKSNSEQGT